MYDLTDKLSIGGGFRYTRDERTGQSALNAPVWPFRLVFAISFALFALQVVFSPERWPASAQRRMVAQHLEGLRP